VNDNPVALTGNVSSPNVTYITVFQGLSYVSFSTIECAVSFDIVKW